MTAHDTSSITYPRAPESITRPRSTGYTLLVCASAVAVLLQGVWAGIFLQHDGARDSASSWITVHARGGEVAIALALAAAIVGFVKVRSRRDLWIGALALAALLTFESFLGGLIVDQSKDVLTAVHVPLGMALMGLAVWLPFRSRTRIREVITR